MSEPPTVMGISEAAYKAGYTAAERDLAAARADAARMKEIIRALLAHPSPQVCRCLWHEDAQLIAGSV